MRFISLSALVVAGCLCASSAQAEWSLGSYGKASATASVVSQYSFRGLAQSNEHPAFQASVDWSHDIGAYAGVWGSNIDFNDTTGADEEIDVYGGYKFSVSGLNFDAGLIGYLYPGAADSFSYDYWEGKLSVGHDFGVVNLGAGVNYSPDFYAGSGDALYLSTNATVPVMKTGVSVVGSFGRQWVDNNTAFALPDYSDWSLGLAYNWQGFDFSAKYVDTNLSQAKCADGCEARGIFSISRTF